VTRRLLVAVGAVLMAVACSSSGASSLPSPAVTVTRPARGLAPQLAAFSGTWQGTWHGPDGRTLPSRLTVEQITPKAARVVYVYGSQPGFAAGWFKASTSVLPSGRISFRSPNRWHALFTFTMRSDGKTIVGTYQIPENPQSTITMHKLA
jgi:hypothetical protein